MGGLLGLGVGFSLLSLIEILYFCGLRSCLRRNRVFLAPAPVHPLNTVEFDVKKRHLRLHIWVLYRIKKTLVFQPLNHASIKEWAKVPRGGTKNWFVPSLMADIVSSGLVLIESNERLTSSTENQRASSSSDVSTSRVSFPSLTMQNTLLI